MMLMAPRGVDWSSLPREILELISSHLTFDPDYVRFRSVCKSWRSAAPRRPQLPWLICLCRCNDAAAPSRLRLFQLSASADRISPVRDPPGHFLAPHRGSSCGWIVTLWCDVLLLWNPLTGARIHLPITGLTFGLSECYGKKERDLMLFKKIEYSFANKLIISIDPALSSSYVVLTSYGEQLAFYRAGNEAWLIMPLPKSNIPTSFILYKGCFYVSACGDVYVCDLGQQNIKLIISVKLESSGLPGINTSHLVESNGELLLVLIYYSYASPDDGYEFSVFKVDLEKMRLVKLQSLGDRALFVDRYDCFSVVASRFNGCEGSRIYCTQIPPLVEGGVAQKLRVFNLEDKSTVFIPCDATDPHPPWNLCAWFTPCLLV